MIVSIIEIIVLSLISAIACSRFLHDPYHDLHVLPVPDLEIPDLTFDSRGMT